MIIIGQCLVSEEIFEEQFVCDLAACKGACCVEGESGAPVEMDELPLLEASLEAANEFMTKKGKAAIAAKGNYVLDNDGDLVTTLVGNHGECAYAFFDDGGIAKCSFEKAFLEGKSTWRKPVSCHLYPIRLGKSAQYITVNYHRWLLCEPACACGIKMKVPVYRFLKDALVRRFGVSWYVELEQASGLWRNAQQ